MLRALRRRRRDPRPDLSVWIRFHRDERLIRRVVELVRPHAGEVIVAADERMPAERLAVVAGARPDRILRVPAVLPAERAVAWIQAQCRGRWALRLDGDEVPGRALLDALPELAADDRFSHYQIPRTWLWGGAGQRLDQRPWWPDHQARLTRNDPALTHIPGRLHTCAEGAGAQRFLETPIHHLVLLLEDQAERRRKAAGYEQAAPGRLMLGLPFNIAYYLPEEHPEPPATALVAPEEEALVEWALAGSDEPAPRFELPAAATTEEVDACWAARPWGPAERTARVLLLDPPAALSAGSRHPLRVRLEQPGPAPLPGGWPDGPQLSAIWSGADGERRPAGAVPAPGPLAPGTATDVELEIRAPHAGHWSLVVRLLDPHGGHVTGAPGATVEVSDER